MHKQLIKEATNEQLKEFIDDAMSMIKETHHDLYEDLESYLYREIYGCHFSDWLLNKALSQMVNEDGTTGGHWNIEQTNNVAKSLDVMFDKYNQYDWNYTMNMLYSDYYGAVPNDALSFGKMAMKFLEDKDAPQGKAFKYYMTMRAK